MHYLVQFYFLQAKWVIWRHRNDVKMGHTSVTSSITIYRNIVSNCKRNASLLLKSNKVQKLTNEAITMFQDLINYDVQ